MRVTNTSKNSVPCNNEKIYNYAQTNKAELVQSVMFVLLKAIKTTVWVGNTYFAVLSYFSAKILVNRLILPDNFVIYMTPAH